MSADSTRSPQAALNVIVGTNGLSTQAAVNVGANAVVGAGGLAGIVSTATKNSQSIQMATTCGVDVTTQPGPYATLTTAGSVLAMDVRSSHYAPVRLQRPQVAYGDYRRASGSESAGPNSITVSAAIEYPAGTYTPVFFQGKRSATFDPSATIKSDPSMAVDIPANTQFWVITYTTVGAGLQFMYRSLDTAHGEAGEITATDKTLTGGVSGTTPGYAPYAIFGDNISPTVLRLAVIGDSIAMGTGDVDYTNWGWPTRAFVGTTIAQKVSFGSETALNFFGQDASARRQALLDGTNFTICEYGINDISSSLVNIQARLINLWRRELARGRRVAQTTITPSTTSTDLWATTTNQTVTSNEAKRVQLNDWIRAGAPMNSSYVAVAIGTAGALVAGQAGHPLATYIDVADVVETSRNSGLWLVTGAANYATTDGLHPSSVIHALIGTFVATTEVPRLTSLLLAA